jgi:hypothetical protein
MIRGDCDFETMIQRLEMKFFIIAFFCFCGIDSSECCTECLNLTFKLSQRPKSSCARAAEASKHGAKNDPRLP